MNIAFSALIAPLAPTPALARSKCETIARLEESALRLFSKHGFEGTSLRDIASDAAVPLSTIDRYFGSKLDLLNELKSSIWKQVNAEREALLKQPIEIENGMPTLRAVLHAFVYPIVKRSIGEERSTLSLRLLRECVALDVHSGSTNAPEWIAKVANRWIAAIVTAEPSLSRERAVWVFSFVVMTAFSEQMQYGWYDRLLPSNSALSTDDLTRMIVDFCHAGIGAVSKS
ncbi:TetR family transcriptional regulator [uncultured Sphingomonas sp.]|uniref:TetR family transcriptional regulator n=1 Tax=uncultured Sphingomonas sp. TaxID=158754 RepID=UPI0035CAF7F8